MHILRPRAAVALALVAVALAGCIEDAERDLRDAYERGREAFRGPEPYSRLVCEDRVLARLEGAPVRVEAGNVTSGSAIFTLPPGARPCNMLVTGTAGPANEVSLAVNPNDAGNLVAGAKDYAEAASDCVWGGQYWSFDGGFTWGNAWLAGAPNDNASGPLAGYRCVTDPVLAFASDGTAYYSGLAYDQAELPRFDPTGYVSARSNVFVAVSRDGGVTFPDIHVVAEADGTAVFHDKQWFVVDPQDPQTLYMTWSAFLIPPPPLPARDVIVFAKSEDGGANWTQWRPIADLAGGEIEAQFSMPVVAPDGTLHVFYLDEDAFAVRHLRSGDGGETFTGPVTVFDVDPLPPRLPNTAFRTHTYPVPTVDAAGTLHVAWADYAAGDADILLRSSTDGGATWSPATRVNDDAEGDDKDQFFPWMDVDDEGGLHVVFYDRRDDPDNTLVGVYYAYRAPGAADFRNMRVGEALFDASTSFHQSGAPYLGDYIALVAGEGRTHMAWADTRNGRADVYHAAVLR